MGPEWSSNLLKVTEPVSLRAETGTLMSLKPLLISLNLKKCLKIALEVGEGDPVRCHFVLQQNKMGETLQVSAGAQRGRDSF
jgi:hypothetical protein